MNASPCYVVRTLPVSFFPNKSNTYEGTWPLGTDKSLYRLLLSVLNPTLTPRAITEVVTTSDSEKWAAWSLQNEPHVHKRNVEETYNSLIFHTITNVYETRQVLWFVLLQIACVTSTRHHAAKLWSQHKSNSSRISAKRRFGPSRKYCQSYAHPPGWWSVRKRAPGATGRQHTGMFRVDHKLCCHACTYSPTPPQNLKIK